MRREAAAHPVAEMIVRRSQTPEHPAEADKAIVEGGRAHQDAAAAQLELPALLGRKGFDHALDLGRRDRLALGVAAPGVVDHAAAAKRSAARAAPPPPAPPPIPPAPGSPAIPVRPPRLIAPAVEEVPLNGLPFELPETSGPLPPPIDTVAVLPPEPTLALPILVPPPIVAFAFVPPFAPLLPSRWRSSRRRGSR